MKDSVTRFNFEDAFKALDEIPVPKAEKGIRANRDDLHETLKRVDKFELLFEDFYDVNDSEDMNTASEEREAEVAKAKLARIEKIVDLDAETEDDILPSYVGKTIIQCPQCMMLFYKDAEDIERNEETPDVVNVGEVCQHCGNDSGYDIIGKVAEETEEAPAEDFGSDNFATEEGTDEGNNENDLSVEDNTTEEGETDDLSAEVDIDSLDLEEVPEDTEEEEVEESLHNSKLLKDIEKKNDLKTENESEKLTLNEDVEDNLDAALKDHEEYIEYLRSMINQEEEALKKATNEQVKKAIQKRIDAFREDLEAALPDAVKEEAATEELPDADETEMEDATNNDTEEVVESLTEAAHHIRQIAGAPTVKFIEQAAEQLGITNYDIVDNGKVGNENAAIITAEYNGKKIDGESGIDDVQTINSLETALDYFKYFLLLPEGYDVEFSNGSKGKISESVHVSKAQKDAEKDSDLKTDIESEHNNLLEAASIVGKENWNKFIKLAKANGIKTMEDLGKFIKDNNVGEKDDIITALEKAAKESIDESLTEALDTKVAFLDLTGSLFDCEDFYREILKKDNFNGEVRLVDDHAMKAVVDAVKNGTEVILYTCNDDYKFSCKEIVDNKNFKVIMVDNESLTEATNVSDSEFDELINSAEFKKPISDAEVRGYFESIESEENDDEVKASVEGEVSPVSIADEEEPEELTEDTIFSKSWWHKIGVYEKILALAAKHAKDNLNCVSFIPLLDPTAVDDDLKVKRYPDNYIKTPYFDKIQNININSQRQHYLDKSTKKQAIADFKTAFNNSFNEVRTLVKNQQKLATYTPVDGIKVKDKEAAVEYIWIVLSQDTVTADNVGDILAKATKAAETTVLLLGSFDKATGDFNWEMKSINGAGLNTINEYEKAGKKFPKDVEETDEEEAEKPKATDGKPDAETDETDEEPTTSADEPTTEKERAKYLKAIIDKNKGFILAALDKNNGAYVSFNKTVQTDVAKFEEYLTERLPTLTFLGMNVNSGIILLDKGTAITPEQKVKATIKDTDILAKSPANSKKVTTNIKAAAAALGISFGTEDLADSFDVSNIDEASFNSRLTESLKNVYENVKDFTMTDCTLDNHKLIIEGTIAFNSGKTRNTQYIFEAKITDDCMTGSNRDLFESGSITLTTQVLNETLYAQALQYKYSIGEKLVEGIVGK